MDGYANSSRRMNSVNALQVPVVPLYPNRRIPVSVNRPSSSLHVPASLKSTDTVASKPDSPLEKWFKYTSQFTPKNTTFRKHAETAILKDKVFYVPVGAFPTLRRVMHERGWVELPPLSTARRTLSEIVASLNQPKMPSVTSVEIRRLAVPFPEIDEVWVKRVFKGVKPKFIWNYGLVNWKTISDNQIINRQPKPGYSFTTKVGIASCLNELHWFTETGISSILFPRCYRLYIDEEKAAFIGDFCMTACIGLLQWLIGTYEQSGKDSIMAEDGQVASQTLSFAISHIKTYVKTRRHRDLDQPANIYVFNQDWEDFLERFNMLVRDNGRLKREDVGCAERWYETAKRNLQRIAPYWPQLKIDGTNNLWICKPGAKSCGTGITIKNLLSDILDLLAKERNQTKDANGDAEVETAQNYWVVQKYIERPLLVYNAKFDIRQWFIVEDWNPLTVWFYKESYLRFCSEPFSIDKFNESVHLCNFSIQKKYSISEYRDTNLPAENVWDNYTFQAYLETLGKMELWDTLIYPGMKKAILGVLMASHESLFNIRKNAFELYGADFMLSDDLSPWLIEINSVPLMSNATEVYRRMSSQVIEDTVKVIFDRREKPNADTGMFELIYKQAPFRFLPVITPEVVIRGKVLPEGDEEGVGSVLVSSQSYQTLKGTASLSLAVNLHKSKPASLVSLRSGIYFMDLMQRMPLKDATKITNLPRTHSDYVRYIQDANFVPSVPSKKALSPSPGDSAINKKQSASKLPRFKQSQTLGAAGEQKKQTAKFSSNIPIASQALKIDPNPISVIKIEQNNRKTSSNVSNHNVTVKEDTDRPTTSPSNLRRKNTVTVHDDHKPKPHEDSNAVTKIHSDTAEINNVRNETPSSGATESTPGRDDTLGKPRSTQ